MRTGDVQAVQHLEAYSTLRTTTMTNIFAVPSVYCCVCSRLLDCWLYCAMHRTWTSKRMHKQGRICYTMSHTR